MARNTAIFSILTAASRVAGLAREVLAARLFGLSAAMGAFTLAFQIPNVVRSLFADAALSAAFIPVFSELQVQGKKREAYRLATTLLLWVTLVLTAVVVLFLILAPVIVPLFQSKHTTQAMIDLAIPLSRVLFPIVLILGINGLIVGILQAYDHFTIPALSPIVWNAVIMFFMVVAQPLTATSTGAIYGYAIGVLFGTIVQLAMSLPMLRRVGFRFERPERWRDERLIRVARLVVPVALGLGLINFNALVNTLLAGRLPEGDAAIAAVDKAFRLYMLPQGMFSVAISTVLFPRLSRLAARRDHEALEATVGTGLRLIALLLLPATAAMVVLPTAMTRLIYQGGAFTSTDTTLVATALLFFAFSLVFSGINLLLTRSFFSLQQPWAVTWLSLANLVVNLIASLALLRYGIGGLVMGTAIADAAMAAGQMVLLRRALGGHLRIGRMRDALVAMVIATVWFAVAAYGVWFVIDQVLGRSVPAQLLSVGLALVVGSVAYGWVVLAAGVPEALDLRRRLRARFAR